MGTWMNGKNLMKQHYLKKKNLWQLKYRRYYQYYQFLSAPGLA